MKEQSANETNFRPKFGMAVESEALPQQDAKDKKKERPTSEADFQHLFVKAVEPEIQPEENAKDKKKEESTNEADFQAFLQKLNSWSLNHNFTQPPPPNIKYKYSPPTRSTLIRIAIQLIREPAFYTQVLHLMNRMSLPPPFEELEAKFPMLREVYDMEKYKDIFGKEILQHPESFSNTEEDESEIESDEENKSKPIEVIPVKRRHKQPSKGIKIQKFVNSVKQVTVPTSAHKAVKPEDMFEQVQRGEAKHLKIEIKSVEKLLNTSNTDTTADNTESNNTADTGFGLIFPVDKAEDMQNTEESQCVPQEVITSEELADNRISANDQRVLPVFKNYHPGKPSHRLYIKNLAKQVEVKDLHFIYRKYVIPGLQNAEFEYNVRLMQEGRMKGQAFITLQNVTQAQLALGETNGYILKNKPMVVQFAKVTKSQEMSH